MCGIIGALSNTISINEPLLQGLNELQNRGYDSMGVSLLMDDNSFIIHKEICTPGDNNNLIGVLDKHVGHVHNCYNGIAHSRWATHGGVTIANAHPHMCYRGEFALVHNGIIENHHELRQELIQHDIPFRSETDTEVIANLISYTYSDASPSTEDITSNVCRAICKTCSRLQGTFGLVVQHKQLPTKLFCIRFGSPLLVGISDNLVMVVSEKSAFNYRIKNYTPLQNHDLVILDGSEAIDLQQYHMKDLEQTEDDKDMGGYKSWTEKEIMEQPDAIKRSMNNGSRILSNYEGVLLGGLRDLMTDMKDIDHIILMGCGTSYHACLLVAPYYRNMTTLSTVQVCDGSEFDVSIVARTGRTCLIVVSQSGETLDIIQSMYKFRANNLSNIVLGVINVVDSLLATQVDAGVYTNCGKERGVASTKSFTTQVIVLFLIACYFSSNRKPFTPLLKDLSVLSDHIHKMLPRAFEAVQNTFAPFVSRFRNIFIIGKSHDFCIAMEASLKIKEITYIHSEAYSSSSLKHGPFALLNSDMLVVLLSTVPSERKKIENAYQEIMARGSPILLISYENIMDCSYYFPIQPHSFSYLEANCFLQVLALGLCTVLGHHPDYPRNLAKVVTVE
jgi:glucosamine--fructose-6-phosphate aminotransferase (isomerizing)